MAENRGDLERLEEVGRVLLSSDLGIVRTATTVAENYGQDITATTTANTDFYIEVKSIKGRDPYWHSGGNTRIVEGYLGPHCYVLNKSTKNGYGRSKWHQFLDGKYDALVYHHLPTGHMYYLTREQVVKDAYTGCGWVYMEHGKEIPDQSKSDELKAFIDLDKALRLR